MAREWRLERNGRASVGPMEEDLIEVFGCISLNEERRVIVLEPRGKRQDRVWPQDGRMHAFSEDTMAMRTQRAKEG